MAEVAPEVIGTAMARAAQRAFGLEVDVNIPGSEERLVEVLRGTRDATQLEVFFSTLAEEGVTLHETARAGGGHREDSPLPRAEYLLNRFPAGTFPLPDEFDEPSMSIAYLTQEKLREAARPGRAAAEPVPAIARVVNEGRPRVASDLVARLAARAGARYKLFEFTLPDDFGRLTRVTVDADTFKNALLAAAAEGTGREPKVFAKRIRIGSGRFPVESRLIKKHLASEAKTPPRVLTVKWYKATKAALASAPGAARAKARAVAVTQAVPNAKPERRRALNRGNRALSS